MKLLKLMFIFIPCYIFLCIQPSTATIDLSNVDLLNFQYFKNLPSEVSGLKAKKSDLKTTLLKPITEHFQKKKAMLTYFKNVLFGHPSHKEIKIIEFHPHVGHVWRPHYEHHYGHKGEYLVEAFGKGYSPEILE